MHTQIDLRTMAPVTVPDWAASTESQLLIDADSSLTDNITDTKGNVTVLESAEGVLFGNTGLTITTGVVTQNSLNTIAFPEIDSYLAATNISTLTAPFTVAAAFKATAVSGAQWIVSSTAGHYFQLGIDANGDFAFEVYTGEIRSSVLATETPTEPHILIGQLHIDGTIRLFVDGVAAPKAITSAAWTNATTAIMLGTGHTTTESHYGPFFEALVINRIAPPLQVKNWFNNKWAIF